MAELGRIEILKKNLAHAVHEPKDPKRSTVFTEPGVEKQPLPIRKAMALALMLREVPVHIYPEELIVGMPFLERPLDPGVEGDQLRSIQPESISGAGYIEGAYKKIGLGHASEPYDPVIQSLQGYGVSSKCCLFPLYATPEEIAEAKRLGLDENSNPGHLQAGHGRVMRHGWSGLKQMAERRLAELDPTGAGGERKAAFLRSVIIALAGAQTLALRYAELAEGMAETENNPRRRLEFKEIAGVCQSIAKRPPQSFREALQIQWLTHLISHTQGAHQMGRFDQYMYTFLERDF
ncbi:MAG: hypothetical protein JSV18_06400, partial [Candidatus Bathyarchaeota archaeon]